MATHTPRRRCHAATSPGDAVMPLHPCNSLINIFSFVSEIHLSRRKSEMTAKGGGKAGKEVCTEL